VGQILYLSALVLAAYFGYSGLAWYYLFVASAVMAAGYFCIRAGQIKAMASERGISFYFKFYLGQVGMMSIITAPVFFLGAFLS
jgi:hypothetical protein